MLDIVHGQDPLVHESRLVCFQSPVQHFIMKKFVSQPVIDVTLNLPESYWGCRLPGLVPQHQQRVLLKAQSKKYTGTRNIIYTFLD